jgi:hypothetical protein
MVNVTYLQMAVPGILRLANSRLKHHVHSFYEKSIIERTIQYVKDRTESFDDYFPRRKERSCKLEHILNWFSMFIDMHNRMITHYAVK